MLIGPSCRVLVGPALFIKMRLIGLQLLLLLATFGSPAGSVGQNKTQERSNQLQIGVEELLLFNRHFLDYLVVYSESDEEPSNRDCVDTLQQLANAYLNRECHGLEWFDSWGKAPSGIYYGSSHVFGNYDQCRQFSWRQIRGEHCVFVVSYAKGMFPFVPGLCVPSVCTPRFIHRIYGDYVSGRNATLEIPADPNLRCSHNSGLVFHGAVITATVIFTCIAILLLTSTIYEAVQLVQGRDVDPLYSSFSVYLNLRGILRIVPKLPSKEAESTYVIECLDGIRSLSMIWIIIYHVQDTLPKVPVINRSSRSAFLEGPASTVMLHSGAFAVDTFFVLSGMLVAWNMLKELDKKGRINLFQFYLQRYIRITVPLAVLVLFVTSFAVYVGEGPQWKPSLFKMQDTCSKYWWSTLLHIQNYVNPGNICLLWTWYLSADMQLYLLAPALIYPLWKYGKRFLLVIAGLALLSMSSVFITFTLYDFRKSSAAPNGDGLMNLTYFPTHTRMAVWLWGTIFGYVLYKTKADGIKLSRRSWNIGWVICFACIVVIVCGQYGFNQTDYHDFSEVLDAFYAALHRTVFGICVMWIILACVNGKAGVINDILCAPLWQPLSKLSYTMYLLHSLLIMMASVASVKLEMHFSVMDLFNRIWAAIGITMSVSLLWSAFFELPFVNLSKHFLINRQVSDEVKKI
ncbi:nose resistant to fluoxetine protein 6-like [Ochlerotatus camptorhynchus]|uniref:nose resistant to fluoxetine protein 6-like n=1 Tax=Ochlerotatus camptorhynchus TaxID=644619 RepID=UPI0031D79E52